MIIDAHCHVGPAPGFIEGEHPPAELLAAYDAAGVDAGIVSVIAKGMRDGNDEVADLCARHPGRFYGFIYLNPTQVPEALDELERCAGMSCFRGVKLHPQNDVYYPFSERYFPVYEEIERRSLPTLWHTGTYPYSQPLQVAYVASRFPGAPSILAHFGLADASWECFPAAEMSPSVHVDISANPIVPLMSQWIERFGPERMLWGSDFPFYDVAHELSRVDALRCSDGAKALIAGGNAQRLFGI